MSLVRKTLEMVAHYTFVWVRLNVRMCQLGSLWLPRNKKQARRKFAAHFHTSYAFRHVVYIFIEPLLLVHNVGVELSHLVDSDSIDVIVFNIEVVAEVFELRNFLVAGNCINDSGEGLVVEHRVYCRFNALRRHQINIINISKPTSMTLLFRVLCRNTLIFFLRRFGFYLSLNI